MSKPSTGGKDQIIHGDCLEVLRTFEDKCIDLTVTSPPYDNLRTYNGYSFDFESIAKELYRVTKDGGVVVWVVGDSTVNGSESGTSFRQALYFKEIGFSLHDTMIYAKTNPVPLSHNRYEQAFEYMFVFSKGNIATVNLIHDNKLHLNAKPGNFYKEAKDSETKKHSSIGRSTTKIKSNIWSYTVGHNYLGHPAVFPESLAADHIKSWSNEGDLILDPFNGSGTTTKMAKQLNRNYIGIDISKEYCDIAESRLRQEILL